MKNETVTLSLLEETILEAIQRTKDILAEKNYAMGVDECVLIIREVIRLSTLAEPVPPAGEEVDCEVCHGSGVLPGLTVKVTKCSYCGNGWKTIAQAEAELRLGDQAHVTRLQTEVERLKDEAGIYRTGYTLLKEELTKARECLKGLCNNRNYPIGYATQQEVEVFLARQSAPAEEEHEHPY